MILSARDASDLAVILREAALAEILPRFRRLGEDAVRTKSGPLDLVTDADEAAERRIAVALAARFPGCFVLGEEAAAADPGLLDRLEEAELAIVLDPIDGTFNYAAGVPLFGTMAAMLVRGEVALSAIYDPMGDDAVLAVRGEGAWLERPDTGRRSDLAVAAPVSPRSDPISFVGLSSRLEALRYDLPGQSPRQVLTANLDLRPRSFGNPKSHRQEG